MFKTGFNLNDQDYFEMPGLNVMFYHNTFPEGHQSGVEVIHHGERTATNSELRLSPAPVKWHPVPEIDEGFSPQTIALQSRRVDKSNNKIRAPYRYPDQDRERKGSFGGLAPRRRGARRSLPQWVTDLLES